MRELRKKRLATSIRTVLINTRVRVDQGQLMRRMFHLVGNPETMTAKLALLYVDPKLLRLGHLRPMIF